MAWVEQVGCESWRVRYSTVAGRIGSIGGFRSENAAQTAAVLIEADRDRGRWIDPSAGRITVAEWTERWWPTINVAERTEENYRRRLDRHLLPRWGAQRLCDITPAQVTAWARDFEIAGYARSTISSQLKLLSMMLTDAVDARLIAANPVRRRRRRGRHLHGTHVERVWATPEQVVRVAARAYGLGGPGAAALIVTAAWTGARWGELTGLQRHNLHLTERQIVIDPVGGALHESGTRLWLGPPKTSASVRTITLPPFLVQVLQAHLRVNDNQFVFTAGDGTWHRAQQLQPPSAPPSGRRYPGR